MCRGPGLSREERQQTETDLIEVARSTRLARSLKSWADDRTIHAGRPQSAPLQERRPPRSEMIDRIRTSVDPPPQTNFGRGYFSGRFAAGEVPAISSQACRKGMARIEGKCTRRENGCAEAQDERVSIAHAQPDAGHAAIVARGIDRDCAASLRPRGARAAAALSAGGRGLEQLSISCRTPAGRSKFRGDFHAVSAFNGAETSIVALFALPGG